MSETEAIVISEGGEPVDNQALIVRDPHAVVSAGTRIANELSGVIEDKKLYNIISGRKFVRCEGWTTMAAILGITPAEESVQQLPDGGFVATVKLIRGRDGMVVGRASAECGMDEPNWKSRPSYARRSMALTRATSKALRLAYSWIMVLSGFEATPAEEMIADHEEERREAKADKPKPYESSRKDTPKGTSTPADWRPPQKETTFLRTGYVCDVTPKTSSTGKPFWFFRLCYAASDTATKDGFSVSCWKKDIGEALMKLDGRKVEAGMEAVVKGKSVYYNLTDMRVLADELPLEPAKEEVTDADIPF